MKTKFMWLFLFWMGVVPCMAGGCIMWLWNALMPDLFGLASIGIGQAVGLFFLCHLLTGAFALGLLVVAGTLHRMSHHHYRGAVHEKWARMADERRRAFVDRHFHYCDEEGGFSGKEKNDETGGEQ